MDRLRGSNGPVVKMATSRPSPVPESGSTRGARGINWNPQTVDAQSLTATRAVIVKRSRAAYETDALVRAGIDKLVSALVGTGITPSSASPDEAVRKAADALFLKWTDEASTDPGLSDFYAQQRALVLGWLRDGEASWRIRLRRPTDGMETVPLQLSLHDSEQVPDFTDGVRWFQGVEISPATGEVTAVKFLNPRTREESIVPAISVVRLFAPSLPGQTRGLPITTTVLLKARELDHWADATLMRQQLATMVAGFVTGGDDLLPEDSDGAVQLQSGTLVRLAPGETVTWNNPPDSAGFGEFWRAGVDTISGALMGMPAWYLLGSTRGEETDRTQRVQLLAFRRQLGQAQHGVIAPALMKLWRTWFVAAVDSGALKLPAGSKVTDHWGAIFRAPRNEHLHPVQDVAAMRDAVRAGVRSLSSVITENGDDPQQVFAEIAADQKAIDALGITVESDARTAAGGGAPAEPDPAPTPIRPQIPGRS